MKRLNDKIFADGQMKIVFAAERREGFVERAITVTLAANRDITLMEFYCATHGICRWTPMNGIGTNALWEEHEIRHHSGVDAHLLATRDERRQGHPAVREIVAAIPDIVIQRAVISALQHPTTPICLALPPPMRVGA